MAKKNTATATANSEIATNSFEYEIVDFEGLKILQIKVDCTRKSDGVEFSYFKFSEILVDNPTLVKFSCFKAKQRMDTMDSEYKGTVLYGEKKGLLPTLQAMGWIGEVTS